MYNGSMRKIVGREVASGFTIIELMLVLAVTGFLFVGLLGGMSGSLARQRYKDAVQDVAVSLRTMYSYVTETMVYTRDNDSACYGLNTSYLSGSTSAIDNENKGRGRSDCVVYGVVATIHTDNEKSNIEFTTIIGLDYNYVRTMLEAGTSDKSLEGMTEMQVLQAADVNNIVATGNTRGKCDSLELVDLLGKVSTKWGTRLLNTDGTNVDKTILIFRSPRTGAIRTYVMNDVLRHDSTGQPINYEEFSSTAHLCSETAVFDDYGIYKALKNPDAFKQEDIKFCISNGDTGIYGGRQRMIFIGAGARNSSGVTLIDMDDEEHNECNG